MFIYAQLDSDSVVVGISQLSSEVLKENLINVTELAEQPEMGSLYDSAKNVFIASQSEKEPIEQRPSAEEAQTQTLLNTEYLVAMSELSNTL